MAKITEFYKKFKIWLWKGQDIDKVLVAILGYQQMEIDFMILGNLLHDIQKEFQKIQIH